MAFNLPTTTKNNISAGPGRIFIGPSGSTPSVDLGAVAEDSVNLEFVSEKRKIMQGNPRTVVLTFSQVQSVRVTVGSLEYNQDNWVYALGSGTTSVAGSTETFTFGGEPAVTQLALHIQHRMFQSGHTLNFYVWLAQSDGGVAFPFTTDEHSLEYAWEGVQSDTNWAGASLGTTEQLVRVDRLTA